jgi:hypothetical protein
MPQLHEVCRHVRSKNAGPFWITVDLFFRDADAYAKHANTASLQVESVARTFGVQPAEVKRFELPDLAVLKLSYPRAKPQGGALERDMHGGQQYVRLLGVEV